MGLTYTTFELKRYIEDQEYLIQKDKESLELHKQRLEWAKKELQEVCVEEFGAHEDEGGMFYSSCKRCGAFGG